MANEAQIFIKGNFLIGQDITSREQFFRIERDQIRPNRTGTDEFFFTYKSAIANTEAENNRAIQGAVAGVGRSKYDFVDIVDVDGNPYADADTLDLFLCTNLGSLEPAILPTAPSGLVEFFIDTIGHVGSGVGWADIGLIGDVPVVLFDKNAEEAQVDTYKVLSRFVLGTIDPVVNFAIYSTTAPVITTGDDVRWQLEARYIGVNELATKSPDETLLITQTLTYLTANNRQEDLSFTLDRTLMTLQDNIHLTLTRIAGDAADNYNADAGVSESVLLAEVTEFNP